LVDNVNILPEIQHQVVLRAQLALGPCTSSSSERREVVSYIRACGVVRFVFSRHYDAHLNHHFWACDRAELIGSYD
jgi:hypothetical protein